MSNLFLSPSLLGLIITVTLAGCTPPPLKVAPPEVPVVPVSKPVEREITDYVDFTGATAAVEAVNIVPRVTGYLIKIPFKEGSEVKAGDLLFEIDPRPYQAQLDQAEGQVTLYQAQLLLAKTNLARDQEISKTPGAVSLQQLDQDRASVSEAESRVKAYQASTEVYKLNLSFTKVLSPISGQISRPYLTLGNLVNQDQTLLTTVVSLDPIFAYFDLDEPTLLRVRRAINEGKIKVPQNGVVPVLMGLQGEEGYPHKGTVDFVNNQVNSTTGSISVRGLFPNPKPAIGSRLISPGMFARIRLPIGQAHSALLVIDRAIASEQGYKYVYVVDAENTVQNRRITTGPLQEDGMRVITEGLKPTDTVVVGGLQQVRPKMKIKTEVIPMPPSNRAGGSDALTDAAAKNNSQTSGKKTPPSEKTKR
jgi:membrane fusion protein, multidrug efflux system